MDKPKVIIYEHRKAEPISNYPEQELEQRIIELYTLIKKKCLTYVENADLLSFEKIYNIKNLFKKRGPPHTPLSSNIANLYDVLHPLFHGESKNNINIVHNSLVIDYPCLKSIVEIIIKMLAPWINKKEFPDMLENKLLKRNFPDDPNSILWKESLQLHLTRLGRVTNVTFKLSNREFDKNIELNIIILFAIFFNIIFQSVHSTGINLNIHSINRRYKKETNPYKISIDNTQKYGANFNDIFIANYIVAQLIERSKKINKLKIVQDDSYISEVLSVYQSSWNNITFDFNEYNLVFTKLMCLTALKEVNINVNILDPMLFTSLNELIVNNNNLELLNITFFPMNKYLSFRKLYVNYLFYSKNKELNKSEEKIKGEIVYPYINSLGNPKMIIPEEKIPLCLYDSFAEHLKDLQLILSNAITNLSSLEVDATPYLEISKYDEYNTSLFIFIYNILSFVKGGRSLKHLTLECKNNTNKYDFLCEKLPLLNNGKIDLSNSNLASIILGIYNFSRLLPLERFPKKELRYIGLENLSLEDLENFNEYCISHRDSFPKLEKVEFVFDYMIESLSKEIVRIFSGALPKQLKLLKIKIENEIEFKKIIKIIKKLYEDFDNLDPKLAITFEGCIQEFEIYKKKFSFIRKVSGMLKQTLSKNKISYNVKFMNFYSFKIRIIKLPKTPSYYYVISSFEKAYKRRNKSEMKIDAFNKQKIYSNIFNFMNGKSISMIVNTD